MTTWGMRKRRIVCELRYWKRKFMHMIGFCPSCYNRVNYLPDGSAICPVCKAR